MILEGAGLKAALAGAAIAAAALAGTTIWALLERSGRLTCKVELQRAVDQVAVLAGAIREQSGAINDLGQATASGRAELRGLVERVGKQHAGTAAGVARLEAELRQKTPAKADGTPQDCRDALKRWREELRP